jgi:ribonuclease T1
VKRVWTFSCPRALSALLSVFFGVLLSVSLGACGKHGSQNAAPDSASAASEASAASAAEQAASVTPAASGVLVTVTKAQLPGEAADTLKLIKSGGPYPFSEDGVLFRNSAALLPAHPRGYYHAYTVRTPGSTDRGQRRIVCGGLRKQTSDCYYTEDYYASFKRIAE